MYVHFHILSSVYTCKEVTFNLFRLSKGISDYMPRKILLDFSNEDDSTESTLTSSGDWSLTGLSQPAFCDLVNNERASY